MAYCIMRFQKLKAASWGSLAGSLAHTMRSRYTPNAVPELIKDNEVLLGPESPKEVIDLVRERWPEKYRKDAVGCIEYFIGASPEWFKKHGGDGDQERYFQGAIDWLKREYGEENVVSVVQHNDETSPHLAAYVVPIDEYGNLNAKKWTGGRPACARMQTRFQEFAGEPVGLERGVRGSKAEHLTIQRFYEENKTLNEKRREIKYDVIDIEAREAEIEEDSAEIRITKKMLKDRELELSRYSYELSDREEAVAKRESKASERLDEAATKLAALTDRETAVLQRETDVSTQSATIADKEREVAKREQEVAQTIRELSSKADSLSTHAQVLDERENAVQSKSDAIEREKLDAYERDRKLQALERELDARGVTLAGGEAALKQRQAEIDAAGEKLRQRLASVRKQEETLESQKHDFEQRRAAWLESNRPRVPQVPELVVKLRAVGDMGRQEALNFIYENDELIDYYNPVEGYNDEAKALLERYADDVKTEEAKRWERIVEPPKGFKPPEM